jgi:microcystin-dependent protein
MAEIGDKSFTTDLVQEIKKAVIAELGTNAFVNRYLATVSAVDTATSDITVYLSGSSDAFSGFRARGLQLPSVSDQVIACIDGQDRWIESVVRPATSTPYLTFATAGGVPTGSIVPYVGATAPTGWLLCNGSTVSRTTYADLFAVIGTRAGAGDGSTTFALPDMKDRFLGGNLLTATQYAQNTAGTLITPVTAIAIPNHSHSIGTHGHGNSFAVTAVTVGNHADHYHVANSAEGTTGTGGSFQGKVNIVAAGSDASLINHTHTFNPAADTTSPQQTEAGAAMNLSHTVSGGVFSGAVTDNTAPIVTGTTPSVTAIGTPKTGLVNFIIKT